ncbi:PIG-L family deacetylase [Myxococcota bacterium]|nr:PIG-L family deacetylase [Myxococcota bacterium]
MGKTALVLCAHADDTEFFAGGTVARMIAEGWTVHEVIATDNGKGSFELPSAELVARSRDQEARAVAEFLGKASVEFLGHPDGDLGAVPVLELRGRFMEAIRRHRPDRLMTFDAFAPFEPHPDHRAVAWAALEAVSFSHFPLYHPEQLERGLEPHLVPERLYFAKSPIHFDHFVDISGFVERKVDALCLHDSQMRLTVQDLRMGLVAAGGNPELLPLLDPDDYRPAIGFLVREWARRIGERCGCEAAEGFRRETTADILG